jgi:hypothetical protein
MFHAGDPKFLIGVIDHFWIMSLMQEDFISASFPLHYRKNMLVNYAFRIME